MGPIYDLADVVDMIRRRAMLIFAVTVLGAVASVFYALSQPREYESTEVIQIERPMIAGDLAPSTVEGSSGRRLQTVQQQLMTRGVMLEIIDKYGLYEDRRGLTAIEKTQTLREAIRIEGIAAAREGMSDDGAISVLSITTRLGTAEQAQLVARELSARTIELYADRRIGEAQATLQFFIGQENDVVGRIQALEDEITAYRASHQLTVPGVMEFNSSQITALSAAILDIEREKIAVQRELDRLDGDGRRQVTLEREVEALQTQLASLDAQRALLEDRLADMSTSLETTPEIQIALDAYDRELTQLREQLEVVTTRRAEAEVSLRLEEERMSERLTILDPAALPDYPVAPSRRRMVFLGTAVSLGLGLLLAFLAELRNPVIRSAAQLQREVGIAPVITLPNVHVTRRKPGPFGRFAAWMRGEVPVTRPQDPPDNLRKSS